MFSLLLALSSDITVSDSIKPLIESGTKVHHTTEFYEYDLYSFSVERIGTQVNELEIWLNSLDSDEDGDDVYQYVGLGEERYWFEGNSDFGIDVRLVHLP